jgi:hypothetical protein
VRREIPTAARRRNDVVEYELPHESPGYRRALSGTGRRLRRYCRASRTVPGDTYHLAFVTYGTTNATSYNIDDYNSFVQAQAALNPSLTGTYMGVVYKAIGSTVEKAANVNALVSGPVYLLNGTKIADDFADMWDGDLDAPINRNQYNENWQAGVWTGSSLAGDPSLPFGGVTPPSFVFSSTFGISSGASSSWIKYNLPSPNFHTYYHSLYALSEPLTAPGVPEPCALALLAIGALSAGAASRPRRRA